MFFILTLKNKMPPGNSFFTNFCWKSFNSAVWTWPCLWKPWTNVFDISTQRRTTVSAHQYFRKQVLQQQRSPRDKFFRVCSHSNHSGEDSDNSPAKAPPQPALSIDDCWPNQLILTFWVFLFKFIGFIIALIFSLF